MFVMLLWVYIHTGQAWKISLAVVGIEPTTFGMVRSVRVCDISELSLVPSILMQSGNHDFFSVLVFCTQVNMMFVMLLWVYILLRAGPYYFAALVLSTRNKRM
jgi:hypothetical protein